MSGTAEAGTTVTIYSGDTALGQATADAGGAYTVTVSTLADGSYSLTAKATDASGNTGAASAALAIEVDTAAPLVPTVTANSPSSTGTPVISGVAEASSTVTVYSGDTALGQASADGGGAYSFTPATMLEDGTYSISATATDGAGNTGAASTALSLMVDTVVPGAPVLSVTTPTNDSTPEMGGTAEAGATVTIYTGGTQLGQTTATGGGVISFEPTTVRSDGSYTLTATATDGAGNTSPASGAVSLVVDTVSPGVPTISVTSPTNDASPVLTGTAEAGSTVTV